MNVLLTGVHGFVGSNLVVSLGREHRLFGLDIVSPEKEGIVKTYSWNDLETGQLPSVDAIIHLAGKAHDTKKRTRAQEYFDINTGLTQKVFDYFLASEARKFIFFSSVKAAADFVVGEVLTEDIIPLPKGPYGESKIAAEKYIQEKLAVSSPAHCGKKVYILRPCMIHGPGNKGNLNLLYQVVKKGLPWPLGDFDNRRSFTSIDNLSYVIEELLARNVVSGIYHMADDEAVSTNELIELMCEELTKLPHIWKINRNLMKGCARVGGFLHLPLNMERLAKLTENYVVSNTKLKQALNIRYMPVRAKEGLRKTIRSFR